MVPKIEICFKRFNVKMAITMLWLEYKIYGGNYEENFFAMLMVVSSFSFITLSAHTLLWSGNYDAVSWETGIEDHSCGTGNGNAILSFVFSDAGSYDKVNSSAKNDYCRTSGKASYVKAFSKDGNGDVKYGGYASAGNTSDASQGATRGTDYAYMGVYS